MRYDYGEYVDKDGNTIPAYCMFETGDDGATLMDANKGRYAYWNILADGCTPEVEDGTTDVFSANGYTAENFAGESVVRIWRTPQYNEWYKKDSDDSYMTLDGSISGIPHFESSCITYSGTEVGETVNWTESNEECLLVPDGTEGIEIPQSTNGRDASDELVLRFDANITLASEIFDFNNKHLLSLGPSTRYNVTDSYVQVQNMFKQKARDCAPEDTACSAANKGDK